MSLLDYIRGNRTGKDAHRLEKEAMTDPFLSEALEGFDSVDDDHLARITAIGKKLNSKHVEKTSHRSMWTSAAGVAVVAFVVISHFASDNSDSALHAQTSILVPISIYIPEAIYAENIAVIATRNTALTKDVSVRFDQNYNLELAMDIEYEALEKELKAIEQQKKGTENENEAVEELKESVAKVASSLPKDNLEAIQIYMPTGINSSQKRYNQHPEPLIGYKEYEKYLAKEIIRPDVWPCEGKKGKVLVEFSVDEDGTPYDLVVEYGICGASDDEAVRLIEKGPKWTPSNRRGKMRIEF